MLFALGVRRRSAGRLRAGCGGVGSFSVGFGTEAASPASDGHLLSRPPKERAAVPTATGAQPLGLDSGRDGVIYLPPA